MGGLVGFIHAGAASKQEGSLTKMLESIVHRGEEVQTYVDEQVALGAREWQVSSTNESVQPSALEIEGIVLLLDGRIYNAEELRADLERRGIRCKTKRTEELLIHAYMQDGLLFLPKLRGVFAFVLWDKNKQHLYLIRDFFGVKPLYYTQQTSDQVFIFGSEIKSFLEHPSFQKELNRLALKPYLTFQYSVLEETFFKGVYKLKPGHYLQYAEGQVEICSYWDIDFASLEASLATSIARIKAVVQESVAYHQRQAGEIGSFLSGGIDSSYLTALLKPENIFSVGFQDYEGIFNETNLAEALATRLGRRIYKKMVTAEDCFEHLPMIQYHLDEPQSNPSCVPLYFLAKLASEHVPVVFSGEGADELFGGYDWYQLTPLMQKYALFPFWLRRLISRLSKHLPANRVTSFLVKGGARVEERFIGQAHVFPEQEALELLRDEYKHGPAVESITAPIYAEVQDKDELTKMQYLDLKLWLPGDILQKADKLTAAHSLEVRVPFLDREVFAVASQLSREHRVQGAKGKVALRKAADEVLPEEWSNRKKIGFPVPIRHWLREEKYYQLVKDMFQTKEAEQFFQTKRLLYYLEEHYQGKQNYARYIWTVYVFLVWYNVFFVER